MSNPDNKGTVLVMGAGDAIGSAIVRKFASAGYTVCAARRNGDQLSGLVEELRSQGRDAHGFSCDARDEEKVIDLFKRIEADIGPLDCVIFNVGANGASYRFY